MLNSPVTRKDIVKVAVVGVVLLCLKGFASYEYNKGLEDMAKYLSQQMQQKAAETQDSFWGQGSTK